MINKVDQIHVLNRTAGIKKKKINEKLIPVYSLIRSAVIIKQIALIFT